MYANLEDFLRELLAGDHSAANLVRLLERDGFLASPLESGFTDRQVRIALIHLLAELGDPTAVPTLERHAALPAFMGGDQVAEAAKQALSVIEGHGQSASDEPLVERMLDRMVGNTTDALNAVLAPQTAPAQIECAGLRGLDLQRALRSLDKAHSLPDTGVGDLSEAAGRVLQLLQETGASQDIYTRIEDLFSDSDDVERWFDAAILLREQGLFHCALEAYDQAVGRFPPEVDAMWWSNRGWLLFIWERYSDAEASFRGALEINPDYEKSRVCLQDVARLMMRLEEDVPTVAALENGDSGRVPLPYESRLLHRLAGQGAQRRTRAYDLLSPANLAVEHPTSGGDGFDTAARMLSERAAASDAESRQYEDVYFISYRWESRPHQVWVLEFATELQDRGYRVIFDQFEDLEVRDRIGPAYRVDRMRDEVPRLVENIGRSTVFLPILTEGYRRCVEPTRSASPSAGGGPQWSLNANKDDGWVFDEWQLALRQRLTGRIRWQAVWRGGPVVSPPFSRNEVANFREDESYQEMLDQHFPSKAG